MSNQIEEARSLEFTTMVQDLVQQKGSRFRAGCDEGTHTGKQAVPVDQIGLVDLDLGHDLRLAEHDGLVDRLDNLDREAAAAIRCLGLRQCGQQQPRQSDQGDGEPCPISVRHGARSTS